MAPRAIHIHIHLADPELRAQLDRIERGLLTEIGDISDMTKVTDAILADIGDTITAQTTVIDSLKAFIEANTTAQAQLTAELEAEGADVTKLKAFNDATKANSARLAGMIVQNTPADTGEPLPAFVKTP